MQKSTASLMMAADFCTFNLKKWKSFYGILLLLAAKRVTGDPASVSSIGSVMKTSSHLVTIRQMDSRETEIGVAGA